MIETSGHLPECSYTSGIWYSLDEPCICHQLRACEQRVLAEREADGPWFRSVVHQCCEDKQTAYAAGLDAAREAVDSMVIETAGNSAATVNQAVAAIDALKETNAAPE